MVVKEWMPNRQRPAQREEKSECGDDEDNAVSRLEHITKEGEGVDSCKGLAMSQVTGARG